MPGRFWRPTDDGPDREVPPGLPHEASPPRVRVVTRGLAAVLWGGVVGLSSLGYLADRSPSPGLARASCEGLDGYIKALVFTDEGRVVAARGSGGLLILWNPTTGQRRTNAVGRDGPFPEAAFASDGASLAVVADRDVAVETWDVARNQRRARVPLRDREPAPLGFSRDGTALAAADRTGLRLWDLRPKDPRITFQREMLHIRALAYGPDGRTVAVSIGDGAVQLWNTVEATQRTLSRGPRRPSTVLAFADRGDMLAFDHWAATSAELWDTATGRRLAVLEAGSPVESLAFAPGGRTLAAACMDGRVRLWDTSSGRLVRTLEVSGTPITAVAFSPDGRDLACGLHGGIRLISIAGWPAPPS